MAEELLPGRGGHGRLHAGDDGRPGHRAIEARPAPDVKVLALTVYEDKEHLRKLLKAGASGYVLKLATGEELIRAVRVVAAGGVYLDPVLAGKVVGDLVERAAPRRGRAEDASLTERESQVVLRVAQGFSNKEIAAQLDISVKTVETHKLRSHGEARAQEPRRGRPVRPAPGVADPGINDPPGGPDRAPNPLLFPLLLATAAPAFALEPIPDKLVVLTFDDSSKSHVTVAAPLLKKHGFGATFFITEGFDFPTNKRDYMTWDEIAQLHRDGFEIGNHTRDHKPPSAKDPKGTAEQLEAINARCQAHGIPRPVSFAYPGNALDKDVLPVLHGLGIKFARRGGAPEYPYDKGRGFAYEPGLDHPLLIPSAGDARPGWTLDDFKRAVSQARGGKIAVLQLHGVPDTAHAWVNTPTPLFESYVKYLADNDYKVIALRDLARYVDPAVVPRTPGA